MRLTRQLPLWSGQKPCVGRQIRPKVEFEFRIGVCGEIDDEVESLGVDRFVDDRIYKVVSSVHRP